MSLTLTSAVVASAPAEVQILSKTGSNHSSAISQLPSVFPGAFHQPFLPAISSRVGQPTGMASPGPNFHDLPSPLTAQAGAPPEWAATAFVTKPSEPYSDAADAVPDAARLPPAPLEQTSLPGFFSRPAVLPAEYAEGDFLSMNVQTLSAVSSTDFGTTNTASVVQDFLTPPHASGAETHAALPAPDSPVHAHLIAGGHGGWPFAVDASAHLGVAVAGIGDLDGDGCPDLAIGAGGGTSKGSVFIAFVNCTVADTGTGMGTGTGPAPAPGMVRSVSVSATPTNDFDYFGSSLGSTSGMSKINVPRGDADGDEVADLAVGAFGEACERKPKCGAVYLMFLQASGAIRPERIKFSNQTSTNSSSMHTIQLPLAPYGEFGRAVAVRYCHDGHSPSAINHQSPSKLVALAVGAPGEADNAGAVHLLSIEMGPSQEKSSRSVVELVSKLRCTPPNVAAGDRLGSSLAWFPGKGSDGTSQLAVGAPGSQGGGRVGHVYLLDAQTGQVSATISPPLPGTNTLFGAAICFGADWDGDGVGDLFVGAPGEQSGGAVYVFYMDNDNGFFGTFSRFGPSALGLAGTPGLLGSSIALLLQNLPYDGVSLGLPRMWSNSGGIVNVNPSGSMPSKASANFLEIY